MGKKLSYPKEGAPPPIKKQAGQIGDEYGVPKDKTAGRGPKRKMENGPRKDEETSEIVWAHLNTRDDNVTHLGVSPP